MCGIVGFSGKTQFNKEKINLLLLWNSFERGRDSTGLYSPKNGLIKDVKQASEFLIQHTFREDNLLISHVRAKTKGINIIKNAHPFLEENICLIHNGTLKNDYALLGKYKLDYQYHDVDSHIICSIIAQEKNFKVLSEIDGAAAFLIHDTTNPKVLYVFRNAERPLFKGVIEGNMYISSIKESLELIGCKNVKEFKENYLYTIIDGLIQGNPKKIVSKPYSAPISNVITNSTTYTTFTPKMFFNYMLRYEGYNNVNLTYGVEYKVVGYTDKFIIILDDKGVEREMYSYIFDRTGHFTVGDYVKARLNMTNKKGEVVIKKNDICYVTKNYYDGNVNVINLDTNNSWDVQNSSLIKLNQKELESFNIKPEDNETCDNLNINNFNNHKTTETLEEDLIFDQDEDNADYEDYFDMQVNEDKLVNDLTNIEIGIKDLQNFVKDLIPEKNKEEYNNKEKELNETLNEVLESYSITNKI